MAPALTWQTDGVVAFTAPWAAEASGGVALRPRGRGAEAQLHEVDGRGRSVQSVSRLDFGADGGCMVTEWSSQSGWVEVGRFPGGGVRWCWAKGPGGQWKVWAEADTGEKILLNKTFNSSAPQLKLFSIKNWQSLDISLLPLQPGPGNAPQVSPQPSQAELKAQVDQLTSEVQSERVQKAELQQRLAEITQEKAEAAEQQEALRQAKQEMQQQLEQLTQEKAEATQQQEALHQEKQELQQQLEQLTQEKAEAAQQQEALHQEKQELQQQLEQLTKKRKICSSRWSSLHRRRLKQHSNGKLCTRKSRNCGSSWSSPGTILPCFRSISLNNPGTTWRCSGRRRLR
ncbi:unnamed protein product [Effrenium voratum]|nr:unnamed protein product [Effrenium voratum]